MYACELTSPITTTAALCSGGLLSFITQNVLLRSFSPTLISIMNTRIFFRLFLKILIVVHIFSMISIAGVWVKTLKLKHRQMIDRPNTNNYFYFVVVFFLSLAPSWMGLAYIDPPEKQQSIWRWLHVILWHTLTLVENFCFKKGPSSSGSGSL